MTAKTAIIYARVSTSRQAEEDLPITGQVERCRRRAAELDATVAQVFRDDGISGRSASRPAFQEAIYYAETFRPDYLVVWSSSRFARNRVDAGFYKRRLEEAGVRLVYVTMDVDTGSDPGWLLDGVMEIFDEWYSRQIATDTRRSMVKNAKAGRWGGGRPPFGYAPEPDPADPNRRRLVVVASEASIAREVFRLRAEEQLGAKQIAAILNDRGLTNRGRRWNRTVVGYLLRNEALAGRTVFGRRSRQTGRRRPREQWIVVDSHEAIIPPELWAQVQETLDGAAENAALGASKSTHVFTGLLYCSCGSGMQTESARGRSRRYWYYNCREAAQHKTHPSRRLPADALDDYLTAALADRVLSRENLLEIYTELSKAVADWESDRDARRLEAVRALRTAEARNARLFEIMERFGADTPNLGDLTRRLRQNNAEVKDLEQQIAAIEAEHAPSLCVTERDLDQLAGWLREVVQECENPRKQRAFFSTFVSRIIVDGERLRIEYDPQKMMTRPHGAVLGAAVWLPEAGRSRTRTVVVGLPAWARISRGGGQARAL